MWWLDCMVPSMLVSQPGYIQVHASGGWDRGLGSWCARQEALGWRIPQMNGHRTFKHNLPPYFLAGPTLCTHAGPLA